VLSITSLNDESFPVLNTVSELQFRILIFDCSHILSSLSPRDGVSRIRKTIIELLIEPSVVVLVESTVVLVEPAVILVESTVVVLIETTIIVLVESAMLLLTSATHSPNLRTILRGTSPFETISILGQIGVLVTLNGESISSVLKDKLFPLLSVLNQLGSAVVIDFSSEIESRNILFQSKFVTCGFYSELFPVLIVIGQLHISANIFDRANEFAISC